MHRLSNKLRLVCGELNFDELHLQRGLLGGRWRGVHIVRGRKVQGLSRISCVQLLFGRDVFCSSRGQIEYDMPHVPNKCQCTYRELSVVSLQVHRRLLRARWRHVHSV